ncbi:MAG: phosphotransferase, partial [Thermomicrobiales bacterium]
GFATRRDHMTTVLDGLPTQLIHGDLTPENVILRCPNTVSGFIDFDHLPMAPRIWDIAKYLSRRFRKGWRHGTEVSDLDRLGHLSGFLRGYHRTNPLSAAEIAALPTGIAAGNLLEVSYMQEISADTLSRRKLPDHDTVLADAVEGARWHLANFEEVVTAVQASVV